MKKDPWRKAEVIGPGLDHHKLQKMHPGQTDGVSGRGCSKLLIISLKISPLFTNLFPLVCYTELPQLSFIYLLDKKYLGKIIYRLPLMQVGWGEAASGNC